MRAGFPHRMGKSEVIRVLSVGIGLLSLALLAAVCPRVRVGSPFHRALCRGTAAVAALADCSLIPGARVGVNALTTACVAALGLPGLGLLQVIALMPK